MKLRVRGRLVHGGLAVEHLAELHRSPIRTLATAAPGPRRVAVLLFNFTNDRSQPWSTTHGVQHDVHGRRARSASYFQEESFGATTMTGDVFGWYQLPTSSSGCAIDSWAASANAAAAAAGVNLSSYQHVVYAFPYVMDCGWAGLAEMPGSHVWINGSFVLRTLGHELSHNLGVHHAASLSCINGTSKVALGTTCSYSEYGDPFDVMGQGGRHTSAWHKGQIGWLDPLAQQTVTASGTYTITPMEWASGGVQSLRDPARRRRPTTCTSSTGARTARLRQLQRQRPGRERRDASGMAPDYGVINLSYLIDTNPTTSTFLDAPLGERPDVHRLGEQHHDQDRRRDRDRRHRRRSRCRGSTPPPPPPPPPPPADTIAPEHAGHADRLGGLRPDRGADLGLRHRQRRRRRLPRLPRRHADLPTIGLYYTDTSPAAGTTPTYTVRAVRRGGQSRRGRPTR